MVMLLTEIGLSRVKVKMHCFVFHVGCKPFSGHLSSVDGWSSKCGWKKLYDRVPEHERSVSHKQNYVEWREVERLTGNAGIDMQVNSEILSQKCMWREVLKQIIDVINSLFGRKGIGFPWIITEDWLCQQWQFSWHHQAAQSL